MYFGAGSPNKNGDLNKDNEQAALEYEQELHQNLWPFKGALCSLTTSEEGGFWKKFKEVNQRFLTAADLRC